jgi:hypothetical protein
VYNRTKPAELRVGLRRGVLFSNLVVSWKVAKRGSAEGLHTECASY